MSQLADEWLELRLFALRQMPAYRLQQGSRAAVYQWMLKVCQLATEQGGIFYDKRGTGVFAIAARYSYFDRHYERNLTRLTFDFRGLSLQEGDPGLLRFLKAQRQSASSPAQLELLPLYFPLLPHLLQQSWAVQAVQLGGYVRLSQGLNARSMGGPSDESLRDFRVVRATSLVEISWVLQEKCRTFDEQPDLAWYWRGSTLERAWESRWLQRCIASQSGLVIEYRGQTMGYIGFLIKDAEAGWPRRATIDLLLHPNWRGRGLLRVLYAILFQELRRRKVGYFQGVSSNPAVLSMATTLARPVNAVFMTHRNDCPGSKRFHNLLP